MLTNDDYTNAGYVYANLINTKIDKSLDDKETIHEIYNFIGNSIGKIESIEQNLVPDDDNNTFVNINIKGYKNFLNIEKSNNDLKNEWNNLTKKYGNQNYNGHLDRIKGNENFTDKEAIEDYRKYHEKRMKKNLEIEIERKESLYKDYNINGIEGILKDSIQRFIYINKDILEGFTLKLDFPDCIYNGINYYLYFVKNY